MIKETKEIQTKQVEVVTDTKYFCDLCDGEIKSQHYSDRASAKVVFKEGYVYPEGGSVDYKEAYFCQVCAPKIEMALRQLGVKFTEREAEY